VPEAHFLGRDAPENPRAEVLVDEAAALVEEGGPGRGIVSARYGDRCTVSPPASSLDKLRAGDFTEIVEYDPHGDRLLLLGQQEPDPTAALHSLVYRARDDVGAILQVELDPDHPAHDALPEAASRGETLDRAMALLEALKEGDAVTVADRWVFAVGGSPEATRRALQESLEQAGG
jgi:hypothetical protein